MVSGGPQCRASVTVSDGDVGVRRPADGVHELLSLVRLVPSSGSGATLYLPGEVEELCLEASNPSGPPDKYRVLVV